jgi:GT2 family glycosyltransferase
VQVASQEMASLEMAAMTGGVDFCVLSYNRLDDLKRCLAGVEQAMSEGDRVIVVDNGSTDGSREYLAGYAARNPVCTVVETTENLGVAGGRNAAYRLARGEFLINLDDDSIPPSDIVARTREAFARFPKAGVIAYRIVHPETGDVQNDNGPHAVEVGNFHGAGYAIDRRTLEAVGLLDETCWFAAEEIEYSIRLRRAGGTVMFVPDIVVLHNSRRRTGEHRLKTERMWAYNFSRVSFAYFPLKTAFVFVMRQFGIEIPLGWRRGGVAHWLRLLKAMVSGAIDGRRNHVALPPDVLAFYLSPDTRPDVGNVPFRTKLAQRLAKAFPRAA